MTTKEFDKMLEELDITLNQYQKKVLYPLIATKDDVTVEYIRIKILELKRFMGEKII